MNRSLVLAAVALAFAAHSAAPKKDQSTVKGSTNVKDGGYAVEGLIDTNDAGRLDGGTPFNGFALGKPLTAKGDLSKDEIKPVVKAHHSELNGCYQALLERNKGKKPLPQGTALLQFEVTPEGKVEGATVGGTDLQEPGFVGCVVEHVQKWVFPPPRGGGKVKVGYPVKLNPPD